MGPLQTKGAFLWRDIGVGAPDAFRPRRPNLPGSVEIEQYRPAAARDNDVVRFDIEMANGDRSRSRAIQSDLMRCRLQTKVCCNRVGGCIAVDRIIILM